MFRAENFVGTARALLPNAWFTNFEDLSGEEVGIVWKHLQDRVGQASWWSDDVDGTGVVTAGGVLSWADITGRRLDNIKVVIFGAGAGGSGVYQQLINNGVKPENILVTDTGPDKDDSGTPHPIHEGRTDVADNFFKAAMRKGKSAQVSVDEFLKGADLVINLGDKKTILRDRNWTLNLIKGMAKDGLILFLTNPDPGLYPDEVEEVRSDLFVGTGNNRYKNPFNNFVVFGYAGLASLLARISVIDGRLTVPLAQGVHQVAKMGQPEFYQGRRIKNRISYGRDWLVPSPDDLRLIKHEAGSGAKAAIHAGLSTLLGEHPTDAQVKALLGEVDARIDYQMRYVEWLREESRRRAVITSKMTYPKRHAPFSMNKGDDPEYYTVPEVSEEEFNIAAEALGISPKDQKTIMGDDGRLKTTALTLLLKRINLRQAEGQDEVAAKKELRIILDLAYVSPALGLAVALKRASLKTFPEGQVSIFHDKQVMDVISRVVPNIVLDVRLAFRELRAER